MTVIKGLPHFSKWLTFPNSAENEQGLFWQLKPAAGSLLNIHDHVPEFLLHIFLDCHETEVSTSMGNSLDKVQIDWTDRSRD